MKKKIIKNANSISTEKDYLLEISPSTILKSKFYMSKNNSIWISLQNKYYAGVSKKAWQIVFPLAALYMCDSAFLTLEITKNKRRSTLKNTKSKLQVS